MQLYIILFFTLSVVPVLSSENRNYYWKDFEGKIPPNAIPAGRSSEGVLQYIGKTNKYGKEIPGSIEPGSYDYQYVLRIAHNDIPTTVNDNIKILCAEYPEQMEWMTINADTFRHIWNDIIVMGGSYDSSHGEFPLLLGRKTIDDYVIVGGVSTWEFEMDLIAVDTKAVKHINVQNGIELLTFNPYLPKRNGVQSLKAGSGYYWEDYKGLIPEKAVPGGVSIDGKSTYIGQTYFNKTIVCGELDQSTKSIYFTHNNVAYKIPINIKILCASHPEQMEWVDVTSKNYWFQWEKDIVMGGFNGLYPYLVGRKSYQGRTVVGAGISYGWTAGLHFYYDDSAKFADDSFQLLSYNFNISTKNCQNSTIVGDPSGNVYNIHYNYVIKDLVINK